jgi:hypothetical protein
MPRTDCRETVSHAKTIRQAGWNDCPSRLKVACAESHYFDCGPRWQGSVYFDREEILLPFLEWNHRGHSPLSFRMSEVAPAG